MYRFDRLDSRDFEPQRVWVKARPHKFKLQPLAPVPAEFLTLETLVINRIKLLSVGSYFLILYSPLQRWVLREFVTGFNWALVLNRALRLAGPLVITAGPVSTL